MKINMTPTRRIWLSYIYGIFAGTFSMLITNGFYRIQEQDAFVTWIQIIIAFVFFLMCVFLVSRNIMKFEKETTWMTIKNPIKVTEEVTAYGPRKSPGKTSSPKHQWTSTDTNG